LILAPHSVGPEFVEGPFFFTATKNVPHFDKLSANGILA
tara:strand:- start:476 stop:592 length:117 start_codon:yes stop_codon:yes gene_type:complete